MSYREYEHGDVKVEFSLVRCIHAAECARGLPGVFDPDRRPWIDPSRADADTIVGVVNRCPSGALRVRRGGELQPPPDAEATMRVVADGPIHVRGPLRLFLPSGESTSESRVALCRCGHSKNKPYCDNSHREAGFHDSGVLGESRGKPRPVTDPSVVELRCIPNGPVRVGGPVTITGTGDRSVKPTSCALCRCGESRSKPFCDGTHKRIGFRAD